MLALRSEVCEEASERVQEGARALGGCAPVSASLSAWVAVMRPLVCTRTFTTGSDGCGTE